MTFEELFAKYQRLSDDLERRTLEANRATHERDEYKKLYELVSLELERTRRHLFGKKAEAVDPSQTQLAFLLATEADPAAQPESGRDGRKGNGDRGERRKPTPHGRNKVPEHLPTERIELLPAEVQREPDAYERIGEEVRELIEWRSASHVRVVVVRPKFVRKDLTTPKVMIAEPLALPIERGLAGPGLLAWVLVSKFCDHLPLHRLEGILARYGAPIARSTLCGWVETMHALCAPLEQVMWQDALTSDYIAVDATGVLVQAKEQCRRGHFWVLASDNGHVLFRYTKRNNKRHVKELLGGYRGYLQADAATVYDFLYLDAECIEVGCWAHCRRRFFEALSTDKDRANVALGFIARLYQIDRDTMEMEVEQRTRERAARAGLVLAGFLTWVDDQALEVLPESPIGKAVTYTRNQRVALSRFLEDGRLRLDNNRSERELRREAVGRKKLAVCRQRRRREVERYLRLADRQLPAAQARALGLSPRPLLHPARLAQEPAAPARPEVLATDKPAARRSAATRRRQAPRHLAQHAARFGRYAAAGLTATTRFTERLQWNATFVSLIASCQQHKLEPWAYLRDLFCIPGCLKEVVA